MRIHALAIIALALTAAPAQAEGVGLVVEPSMESILPACDMDSDSLPSQVVVGTATSGCSMSVGSWCEAVIVTINRDHVPPKVNANPNWMCIEDTIGELLNRSEPRPSLPINLET